MIAIPNALAGYLLSVSIVIVVVYRIVILIILVDYYLVV